MIVELYGWTRDQWEAATEDMVRRGEAPPPVEAWPDVMSRWDARHVSPPGTNTILGVDTLGRALPPLEPSQAARAWVRAAFRYAVTVHGS